LCVSCDVSDRHLIATFLHRFDSAHRDCRRHADKNELSSRYLEMISPRPRAARKDDDLAAPPC